MISLVMKKSSFNQVVFYGVSDIDFCIIVNDVVDLKTYKFYDRAFSVCETINNLFKIPDVQVWQKSSYVNNYLKNDGKYSESRILITLYGEEFKDKNIKIEISQELIHKNALLYASSNLFKSSLSGKKIISSSKQLERAYEKFLKNILKLSKKDTSKELKVKNTEFYFNSIDLISNSVKQEKIKNPKTIPLTYSNIASNCLVKVNPLVEEAISQRISEMPILLKNNLQSIGLSTGACSRKRYSLFLIFKDEVSVRDTFMSNKESLEYFNKNSKKIQINSCSLQLIFLPKNLLKYHFENEFLNGAPWGDYLYYNFSKSYFGLDLENEKVLPSYNEIVLRLESFIIYAEKKLYELKFTDSKALHTKSKGTWLNFVYAILPSCIVLLKKKTLVLDPEEAILEYISMDTLDKALLLEVLEKYVYNDTLRNYSTKEYTVFLNDIFPLIVNWVKTIKEEIVIIEY
jgi:hypothetical protein